MIDVNYFNKNVKLKTEIQYTYKKVISVCLFECQIITPVFIVLSRTRQMFLGWFKQVYS